MESLYEEYVNRILLAFYEAHQDFQYPGVRAHGLRGIVLATDAGIVSRDEWKARDYWASKKRWDIVAALRELLLDEGYIKRTEDDTDEHMHPDRWNFRLTPQGRDYARQLLSASDETDSKPEGRTSVTKSIRIFISSTWLDLQLEREAVEKALHRMQEAEFSGMEYFGSRPETPKDASLDEVDRSDIYIGLFAHRYGSGITEAEYRRAVERAVPCLIYLKDDSVPVIPAHIERDAEGMTKLEALKKELKAKHTVSFFTSPDQLATQVAVDLHNLLGQTQTTKKEVSTSQGPKYQINIEHAQGLAIGDGAQVIQYPIQSEVSEQIHTKLDTLLTGQEGIREGLTDLQATLVSRYDASEQAIVAKITRHLDQVQSATVQKVLDAVEGKTIPDNELQETLTAVEHTLAEVRQLGDKLSNPILVNEVDQLAEMIDIPKMDVRHRLKVTLPIVPVLLAYEGEVELNSGLNLEAVWQRLVAKIRN